jgi:hypothetical protein
MNATEKPHLGIDLKPVKSSNLAAIGYDPATKRMAVNFKSGGTHVYHDVGQEHFDAFADAESVGKHFHSHIRNAFKSTKHE